MTGDESSDGNRVKIDQEQNMGKTVRCIKIRDEKNWLIVDSISSLTRSYLRNEIIIWAARHNLF